MMAVFQEPLVLASGPSGSLLAGRAYIVWLSPLLVMVVTSVFLSLWFKKTRLVFKGLAYQLGIVSLMLCGGALNVLWFLGLFAGNPPGEIVILALQSILVGVGVSLFRIEIDRVFGHLGANHTLYIAVTGVFVSLLVFVLITWLPNPAWLFVKATLPLLMLVCHRRAIKGFESERYYNHGRDSELYVPVKFLSTSFFQGAAFGVMSGGVIVLIGSGQGWATGTGSRLLMLAVTVVAVLLLRLNYNQLLYKAGFPLMALGFVALGVAPALPAAGGVIAWAGYFFLDAVLWSLGAYLMKNVGLPATWIASFPGAALSCGTLLGGAVGVWAFRSGSANSALFALLTAFFLTTVALFMTSSRNIRFGWGTIRPGGTETPGSRFDSICRYLCREHQLTRREAEVLPLLAQNKTRRSISKVLGVSPETTKTHTQNIYRKLTIHSQEDLHDVFESTSVWLGQDEVSASEAFSQPSQ
jgi:DNA-binding CsgD family transcriptional regulator